MGGLVFAPPPPQPDPLLTVYVTTPTSSLTLSRKLSEVVDFESRLHAQYPRRFATRQPSTATTASATPVKKRNVLASLTRTLSPRRSSSTSISHSSFSSSRTTLALVDLKDLSSTLTQASTDATIRSDDAWTAFFEVRKDDLESARVERRIKRARSDQTMHLGKVDINSIGAIAAATAGGGGGGGRSKTGEGLAGGSRSDRQDVSVMSGSTNEVIDTPYFERTSYFASGDDTTPRETPMDVEVVPVNEDEVEKAQRPSSSVEDSKPTAVVATRPAVADEQAPDEMVAEDAAIPEEAEPVVEPSSTPDPIHPPSHSLHPSSSLPGSQMARSLSTQSAVSIDKRSRGVTIESFDIMRVLGKGCAGKVLLVRKHETDNYYALKAITKRHVLAHRELDHTRTEQSVLKTCARDNSNPFVVRLHYSFHDQDTLYLALDFHPGGDLATQLARWGRLGRDRARFYIAEICEGVEGLHRAGIIYRDLKPENVLISADGHVVLTDFGLSKDFGHSRVTPPTATLKDELPRPHWLSAHPTQRSASTPPGGASWIYGRRETTMSFCGTAEYLAPEVLLGEPYSYEVDAWSAGTMLYEMLAGVTPFYAEDHATMYRRVLHEDLTFEEREDEWVFDDDTKSFIRGMLQRDPLLRMSDTRIKSHPYFSMIDWSHVYHKRYVPPFVPILNPLDPTDTSQFDDMFLSMMPQVHAEGEEDVPGGARGDEPSSGVEPQAAVDTDGRDVFDGYSYYGRDSDSIKRFEMDPETETEEGHSLRHAQVEDGHEKSSSIADSQVDAMLVDHSAQASSSNTIDEESIEALDSPGSADDRNGLDESGLASSDTTLSSIATVSTQPTTLPADSPVAARRRQSSSRSNLEPVSEVPIMSSPIVATETVLEELEENSDSEWDMVDSAKDVGGFSRNGGREATLFAKGFRDTYRLVVAPLSTPLRSPSGFRHGSRIGSRKGSSSSARSSLVGTSISTTPEPPRSPSGILRFTSVRNVSKSKDLPTHTSQRSLFDPIRPASSSGVASPPSPRPELQRSATSVRSTEPKAKISSSFSTSSLAQAVEGTPRRAGSTIKKLAKSAFLSKPSNP
ncbi:hypothetical protein JCM10212_000878 [Sporobolomyces blumeae]